jgi:type IV secretory pathway VirB2 component (pilin)
MHYCRYLFNIVPNMEQVPNLSQFVGNITSVIITIVQSVLVLIVIFLGIQFIMYSNNPQERSRLGTKIIWVLVGLFIIFGAQNFSHFLHALIPS